MENTEDRAGATSEQQDNVINTVNSLDPYGPSWQLVPGNVSEDVVRAQIPTSGIGDLTFTRASDATRTNSAGVIERTPWNLVTWSEQFDNAAWSKNTGGTSTVTVTANAGIAPNGTNTAERIQLTRDALGFAQVTQTVGALANQSYTFSVYLKSLSGTPRVMFGSFGGTNAQTAVLTNEWVRYTWTATAPSTSAFAMLMIWGGIASTSLSADFLAWGYQLVEGTDAKPYFATTNRQDVPRLDYRNADGSVSTCPRLLLEPQRTNSIRNSTMVGAVAGTPGTLPTNYGEYLSGLTRTVAGIGTENGVPYIDLRFNGTASDTIILINFETASGISALNGQNWSSSFYVKTIATSQPPLKYSLRSTQRSSGSNVGSFILEFTPTTTLARYTQTFTTNNATITHIQPYISFDLTIGQTYDFTIRIAAPQMELGAYATTFIPTTTAAVTRLADLAIKTGVSSLIGQTEGTLFFEFTGPTQSNVYFSLSSALGLSNTILVGINPSSQLNARIFASFPTVAVNVGTFAYTAGQSYKVAFAYNSTQCVLAVNGSLQTTGGFAGFPAGTLSRIGIDNASGTQVLIGTHNQAALFPTRLTNAQLAAITTL